MSTTNTKGYDIVSIDILIFNYACKLTNAEAFIPKSKRGVMESRLLAYEHATTINEIASWANNLIGKDVPGDPGYLVINVLQFQLIFSQSAY